MLQKTLVIPYSLTDFCLYWWLTDHLISDYITVVMTCERWERFLECTTEKNIPFKHFSTQAFKPAALLPLHCWEQKSAKSSSSASALFQGLICLLSSLILQIRSKTIGNTVRVLPFSPYIGHYRRMSVNSKVSNITKKSIVARAPWGLFNFSVTSK